MAKYGTTKYESNKQEKRVAKEVKGRTVVASGAIDIFKGDVRSDSLLVECKTTLKDYYVLSYHTWEKIRQEAIRDGMRDPVMCVDLKNGEQRLAIVEASTFTDYVEWLPISHVIVNNWCRTKGSTKKITYIDENHSMMLTFENKRFLSNPHANHDINLFITPWNVFALYNKTRSKNV